MHKKFASKFSRFLRYQPVISCYKIDQHMHVLGCTKLNSKHTTFESIWNTHHNQTSILIKCQASYLTQIIAIIRTQTRLHNVTKLICKISFTLSTVYFDHISLNPTITAICMHPLTCFHQPNSALNISKPIQQNSTF